jgi:hypothetical protein
MKINLPILLTVSTVSKDTSEVHFLFTPQKNFRMETNKNKLTLRWNNEKRLNFSIRNDDDEYFSC